MAGKSDAPVDVIAVSNQAHRENSRARTSNRNATTQGANSDRHLSVPAVSFIVMRIGSLDLSRNTLEQAFSSRPSGGRCSASNLCGKGRLASRL